MANLANRRKWQYGSGSWPAFNGLQRNLAMANNGWLWQLSQRNNDASENESNHNNENNVETGPGDGEGR